MSMVYPVTCTNLVISYQALADSACAHRDYGKAILDIGSCNFSETVVLRNPILYSSSTGIGYPPSRRLAHDVSVDHDKIIWSLRQGYRLLTPSWP
jgi:hypothetical protein